MQVKHIWSTPDAETLIAYCARVSSPNQENPDYEKLLRYCIRHKHWSIYEMADMCVEITTSRAISAQILRHRSFHFQEFSQRYAQAQSFETVSLRKQAETNRQSSSDDLDKNLNERLTELVEDAIAYSQHVYDQLLGAGVAKECARMILPMTTTTKLYMKGTIRDWLAYLNIRLTENTQLEHREIAQKIRTIFVEQFPVISAAAGLEFSDGNFM